ncbi:MAG: peptidoglycan editing factor PgeF [Candidatus Firestonebacteria bacterium]
MKKVKFWVLKNKNITAFTSVKPRSYKQKEFNKNFPLLLKSIKINPKITAFVKQIHGSRVLEVKSEKFVNGQEADGFVSAKNNYLLLIFTADCLPVFLYDVKNSFIGITHCGWKSTRKNIVGKAVEKLKKKGSKVRDLRVVLGPRIRECCYEVSPEFALNFKAKYGNKSIYMRGGKLYFSLSDVVKLQLKKLKIPAMNIEDTGACTCCDKKKYFSYRRDGSGTGRMVSGIMAR